MLINVKDLYRKVGEVKESSSTVSERTTADTRLLEDLIMKEAPRRDNLEVLNFEKEGLSEENLFEDGVLKSLADKYGIHAFLRIKLRDYHVTRRKSKDHYPHNQHVYQDTTLHGISFSCALISPEGKYLDFLDHRNSIEERHTYQAVPGQDTTTILEAGFDVKGDYREIAHFLGLESLETMGMRVFEYAGF